MTEDEVRGDPNVDRDVFGPGIDGLVVLSTA